MSGQFGNGASGASPPSSLIAHEPHEYTVEDIRPLLKGVRKSGKGWIARCPAHDDQNASLSFGVGEERSLVMKCHAGCTYDQILAALRYPPTRKDTADLPSSAVEDLGEPTAIYDYSDERGRLAYQVLRYVVDGKKTFRQRRPNGKGGWTWSLPKDVPHYLYKLAEFLKRKTHTTAFLVEGEKDADTLWSHKLPALTNVAGAGKWREEYAQQLVAAGVTQTVVFPDNDPTGKAHAEAVAASVHAAGVRVKVVHLPVVKKGDVSDYLAEHSKEKLFALIQQTPLYTPPAQESKVEPEPSTSPGSRDFGAIISTNMGDVEPEPVPWLWPGRIPLGMLTIIAGPPGVGKSYVSLDVAARITTGAIWPDVGQSAPQGTVVLLAAEDSAKHTIKPRLAALGADCYKVEKIDAVQLPDGKGKKGFSLTTDLTSLEQMIQRAGAKIVIVDPVNSYLGGKIDGFKDVEVRGVLDPVKEMAERLEVSIILIMHVKKGAEEEIIYRIGGSYGFGALARSICFCTRDEENPGRVYFTNPKMNIAPPASTLAYRVHPDMTLEWDREEIKLTAQEILGTAKVKPGPKPTARDAARLWLANYLKDGPKPSTEGELAAIEAGITEATLRRAMKALGVEAKPERDPATNQITRWIWELPPCGPEPAF